MHGLGPPICINIEGTIFHLYVRTKWVSDKVLGLTCDNNQRENNHCVLKQRDLYGVYVQSI
jgi:hypothetical protein